MSTYYQEVEAFHFQMKEVLNQSIQDNKAAKQRQDVVKFYLIFEVFG